MNNGVIVCNAGPLIALSLVGNLDLLHRLYDSNSRSNFRNTLISKEYG